MSVYTTSCITFCFSSLSLPSLWKSYQVQSQLSWSFLSLWLTHSSFCLYCVCWYFFSRGPNHLLLFLHVIHSPPSFSTHAFLILCPLACRLLKNPTFSLHLISTYMSKSNKSTVMYTTILPFMLLYFAHLKISPCISPSSENIQNT